MVLRLFTLFLIILYGTASSAQEGRWQVKAGASYLHCSDPLGEGHGEHTGRRAAGMGGHIGIAHELPIRRVFGARAELLFEVRQVGYEVVQGRIPLGWPSGGEFVSTGDRVTRMTHIQIPLLFTIREWSLLRIDAGISTGYLIQARDRIRTADPKGTAAEKTVAHSDDTRSLARFECAAVVGAEVDSGRRLGMGLRYLHGLSDLDRAPAASPSFPRTWQISLTYRLGEQG